MNSYELSRKWFNYCFDNPEKVKPIHTAIYFFSIEHCNRLGWKEKFGFPSQMVMEAVGVRNWKTYSKALNELVDFGFIKMIETSKNQYSSNIIALVKNTKAPTKALDKALSKHSTKQGQSTASIDKQLNKEQRTINNNVVVGFEWLDVEGYFYKQAVEYKLDSAKLLKKVLWAYEYYKELGFKNSKGKEIKNLNSTIKNNWIKDYDEYLVVKKFIKPTIAL